MQNNTESNTPSNNRTTTHKPKFKVKTRFTYALCAIGLFILVVLINYRVSPTPDDHTSKFTFGTHRVTIVNTGGKPYGGPTGIIKNDT